MTGDKFRKYEPFFGKWKISRELGKGTFGQVFEIYWEDDLGSRSTSALKVIHIPSEEALKIQIEEQPNMEAVRNYFLKQVEKIKDEIRILQKCKGHSNIVSYEDHMIVESVGEDKIGWDILIRMELLYPLNPYFSRAEATQYDIVQMWLDITNALIYCEEQNIIHRDIKPANILLSASGRYKLSDFGVARKSMQETAASTRVGTERYMAPEVFKNQKYDKRADYYSLGCVIYYFLNKRRHVFMPPYPQEVDSDDNERAEKKRISGEKIPKIPNVSREVNEVLLKSMAYRPQNRYKSARELYRAIQNLLETQGNDLRQRYLSEDEPGTNHPSTKRVKTAPKSYDPSVRKSKASHSVSPIVVAGVFLMAGIGGIIYGIYSKKDSRLTIEMDSVVNEQGLLQTNASQIVFSGTSKADSRLVLHINDQEDMIESDGKWEYTVPLEILEDQAYNNISISYEDGSEQSEELKFYMDSAAITPEPTATPTPKPTKEPKPTVTPTPEPTEEPTPEPTAEPTPEPTATPTPEPTATPTPEPTATPTPEPTATPTPEPTATPTPEPTATPTPEPTATPTPEPTATPTPEPTATPTPEPTATPTPEPTATPTPVPTARVLGQLERPGDGDKLETDLKIKAWVLTNDSVKNLDIYADFVADGKVVKSLALDHTEMGDNTFEKRCRKNAAEIAAVKGYEIKGSQSIEGVSDGTYDLRLRACDSDSDLDEVLETVQIQVNGGHAKSNVDVLEFMGVTDDEKVLDTHYIYEEKGFAIGLDVQDTDQAITANPNQILLTGWMNAEKGTSVGMFFQIDSELYTADALAERGGSFTITRVPRYLEKMDSALIGSTVRDMDEAGCIINLNLPFLENGEHTIAITFNVAAPGAEPEIVDIIPMKIIADSAEGVKENAAEKITASWAKEFPQPTATPTPEPTPAANPEEKQ